MSARPHGLWIGLLGLAAASIVYYGLYLTAGFNYADDGNYAQICYELARGRPFSDLAANYGLLWFKVGEALFRLFGVDFVLVRLLFFACIALTTGLIFVALARAFGTIWPAVAFAAVALLVPAFPATAFYGLCVLANAAAQLRWTERIDSPRAAALAGAVLGITFQIRPDFGFVFLLTLLLLAGLGGRWRLRETSRLAGAAFAGVIAGSLPFFLCALVGGYAGPLAAQYGAYVALAVEYIGNGLRGLDHGAALAVLQRPGWETPARAILVYAPAVIMAAFGFWFLGQALRWWRNDDRARLGAGIVALAAALAGFPQYFFFRPDLAHVANFMPGFILMAGVFLALLSRTTPRAVFGAAAALVAAHLCLWLGIGLPSPETGSIGVAAGRSERFTAENGVDVRVSPAEKQELTALRDLILARTPPDAAIVCLPYCPGLAFMTARRMLLPEFYADETFLVRKPDWLPAAIARTEAARPPAVLVADWPINGTEQSRFSVWAAPYMAAVAGLAHEITTVGGVQAFLLAPAPAR